MIKSLQKYKMYVLVVAGVLIMISFLLADVLRQIGTYSHDNERVYSIDGDKVTRDDHNKAGIHLDGIKRALNNSDLLKNRFGLDEDAAEWQLVSAAAERAGVLGGPVDGRAIARQLTIGKLSAQAQANGVQDWRAFVKTSGNFTDEQVDQYVEQQVDALLAGAGRGSNPVQEGANAFAELQGLFRLDRSYRDVPQTSEARVISQARNQYDTAVLKYIFVPVTEARIAAAPAPTAEEMQAQFEKFKDVLVGTGENGAGYRQNDRITYSWFSIDKSAISRAVTVDPIEVQKRSITRQGPDGKVDSAVRRQIEDEIRGEITQRILEEFTGALRTEILRSSALLPEKDGYKVLPADWKKPDLNAVIAAALHRLPADKRAAITPPVAASVTTPQDARAFVAEKGIGTSRVVRPGQQLPTYLRDVLFGAKELGKPAAGGRIPAQVGLPVATPFTDNNGNLCFVMLDGAIPSAVPGSLDEVRPMVEKDLRRIKAVAQLKTELEGVLVPIATLGMVEAPAQLEKLGYPGLIAQDAETRRGGYVLQFQQFGQGYPYRVDNGKGSPAGAEVQEAGFVEAAVSRAEKLDPTRKVDGETALERTFVHPLTSGGGVVLAQVTGLKPLTRESFRIAMANGNVRQTLETKDMPPVKAAPFNAEALIKRLNVTGLDRSKKPEDETP